MGGFVFQLGETMSYTRKQQDKNRRSKSVKQRSLERELFLDKRYQARKVSSNKGRSRGWRYIDEETDESSTID